MTAGQSYPPLGFSSQGQPVYQYLPPDTPQPAAAQAVATTPPGPPPEPPRKPAGPGRRGLLAIAGVLVLLVVVVGALRWFGDDDATDYSRRADPPASQNVDDPYLGGNEDPNESKQRPTPSRPATSSAPGGSAQPAAPGEYEGKQVTYEVITTASATVLYIDQTSVQFGRFDGGTWRKSFTATMNPLRITVLASTGEASCRISVDGEAVAEKSLAADAPDRTLTCSG
ncbi:MAG: hypothetical protein QM658_09400 [Gordonia sp. (in: high G+C Gram-positive bacteria)]